MRGHAASRDLPGETTAVFINGLYLSCHARHDTPFTIALSCDSQNENMHH